MFHTFRFLRAQLMAFELSSARVQSPHETPLPARTPLARARALQRACATVCNMHGLRTRVSGQLPAGPVVYVANHLGYVDPVAICSLTPCAPIAKSEVARWPFIGAAARHTSVIFVRRGDVASGAATLREALRQLEAGVSVLNFPEGTTTRGEVLQFYRGIFGVAARAGVPVVPLALSFSEPGLCWVDDEGFLHHYSTAMLGKSHEVEVQVGPPMFMRSREVPADLAARARDWIIEARSDAVSRGRPATELPGVLHTVDVLARVQRQVREHAAAATAAVHEQ